MLDLQVFRMTLLTAQNLHATRLAWRWINPGARLLPDGWSIRGAEPTHNPLRVISVLALSNTTLATAGLTDLCDEAQICR